MAHGSQRTGSLSLSFSMWIQAEAGSVVGAGLQVLRFWSLSQELSRVLSPAIIFKYEVVLLLFCIPVNSLDCEETSLSCCNLVIRIRSVAASQASITEGCFSSAPLSGLRASPLVWTSISPAEEGQLIVTGAHINRVECSSNGTLKEFLP